MSRLYLILLLGGLLTACAPSTTGGISAPQAEPPAFVKEFQAYMEGPKKTLREDVELLLKAIQEADLEALWNLKQVDTIWDRTLAKPPVKGLYACLYGDKSDLLLRVVVSPMAKYNDPLTAESWLKNQEARGRLAKKYGQYQLGERVVLRSDTIYADLVRGKETRTLVIRLDNNPNWRAVSRSVLYLRGQARAPEGWQNVPEAKVLYQSLGSKLVEYLNNPPSLWDRYCPHLDIAAVEPGSLTSKSTVNLDTLLFEIAVDTKERP